jgi:pimeloyl-ACP methyl ester carboxylesterase
MTLRNAVSLGMVAAIVTTVNFGVVHAGRNSPASDASAESLPMPPDAATGTPAQLRTADGLTLGAHLYGGGDTGVILAHQYNGDQTGWTDFAMILAAHGYTALTFDFRGFPESGLVVHVPPSPVDLKAAYDFMRPRVKHLFIVGASMGADASLALASQYPVSGLILISAPVEFGGPQRVRRGCQGKGADAVRREHRRPLHGRQFRNSLRAPDGRKVAQNLSGP